MRGSWAFGAVGLAALLGAGYVAVRSEPPAAAIPASAPPPVAFPAPTSSNEPRRVDRKPAAPARTIVKNDAPRPAVTDAAATAAPMIPPAATPILAALELAPPSVFSRPTADDHGKVVQVNKDAVIGIRLDQTVTTETAHVDDKITARVARDVVVDDRTAIASGARLEGVVTLVERGGHASDRGKIGIRFHTLILADHKRIAIQTDTIFRESDPAGEAAGNRGASAAIGALLSGSARQSAFTATPRPPVVTPETRRDARIPAGASLTVKLTAPISIDRAR